MKTQKHIGIWMDHATANLIDTTGGKVITNTIKSEFTHREKERTLLGGEYMMHNTEQQQQHAYYKKLEEVIKDYDEVVLFGPTNAKEELLNILKGGKIFQKIKIEVLPADKMTENQQHAFVKDYFNNK